jgi:hypothetical protein
VEDVIDIRLARWKAASENLPKKKDTPIANFAKNSDGSSVARKGKADFKLQIGNSLLRKFD